MSAPIEKIFPYVKIILRVKPPMKGGENMIDEKEIALQLTLKYLEICNPFDAPRHMPLSAEELENDSKKIAGIYNTIYSGLNTKFDLSALI